MSGRMCFSFQASGHKYRALDGVGGIAMRLYCPRCGRVIPADQGYNVEMWHGVDLPPEPEPMIEITSPDEPLH